jgi:hypothetical protein
MRNFSKEDVASPAVSGEQNRMNMEEHSILFFGIQSWYNAMSNILRMCVTRKKVIRESKWRVLDANKSIFL